MTKTKQSKNHKALSTMVATVILIAISFSVSLIIYTVAINMANNIGTQVQTWIKLEDAKFIRNGTDCAVIVKIRNTGSGTATIQSITVSNSNNDLVVSSDSIMQTVDASRTVEIGLTNAASWKWQIVDKTMLSLSNFTLTSGRYKVQVTTNTGFPESGYFYMSQ